ncbi:hypothetical protein BDK51DRAFT_42708 [Blyttiomyces helicus]|uniref:Uncharacterized protein n=1 Tax=Blyttiomyces helicus TaxID=388810 RepID=A0A4P9VY64_9FUNG|nr:hypothetical protein BDK51DRAFT_42708 [Blyttiomyces helicus]|eukprot:RKO83250.1 hypothetical protein BDK51DRAFT_42708 [Blyttiomyces helicus]
MSTTASPLATASTSADSASTPPTGGLLEGLSLGGGAVVLAGLTAAWSGRAVNAAHSRGVRQQDNWSHLLPIAELAYNNAQHASTGQTHLWANYGFHPRFDIALPTISKNPAAK